MKVLLAICVLLLSFAGGVYMQAAGENCGTSNTCATDLVCQESKCRSKIEGTCTANSTEECVVTAAVCSASTKCACPAEANPNGDKTTCDCKVKGQVISKDKTKCVAKITQECAKAEDCISNADCTNKTCICKADYIANADGDLCQSKVTGNCSVEKDCLKNGMCDGGKCMCKANYTSTFNQMECRLVRGQKCSSNDVCGENAECKTNKCDCKANYYSQPGQRCGMKVGAQCAKDMDCGPNAQCTSKKCTCMTKYTTIVDGKYCTDGASAEVASIVLLLAALVTAHWM